MNIKDYLDWRGDLSFKVSPFNEVDNLIICEMAYTTFDRFIKPNKKYKLSEISKLFFDSVSNKQLNDDKSFISEAPFVLKAMAESNRFKDAVIHDFVSKIDKETSEQFCAFCLDLSDKTTYIVFRGTDDTLIGWKEDFLLSYKKMKAQDEALAYLQANIKISKKYRIGGHSKGGNLAEYASLSLPSSKQRQIINVYSNDGPGNKSTFFGDDYKKAYERLSDKLIKFVPEIDIFGSIYNNKYKPIVIKSSGNAFMMHSAVNWQVQGTKFIRGKQSKETKLLTKAYKEFLNGVSEEKKKEFVNELFAAADKAGLKNISDISKGGIPVLIKTISKFAEMNEESKATALALLDAFVGVGKEDIIEEAGYIKDNVVKLVSSAKKDLQKRISFTKK